MIFPIVLTGKTCDRICLTLKKGNFPKYFIQRPTIDMVDEI